jgi:hypothetical protein
MLPTQKRAVLIMAFVPEYRCGAAPAFHRIPFLSPQIVGEPVTGHKISCSTDFVKPKTAFEIQETR